MIQIRITVSQGPGVSWSGLALIMLNSYTHSGFLWFRWLDWLSLPVLMAPMTTMAMATALTRSMNSTYIVHLLCSEQPDMVDMCVHKVWKNNKIISVSRFSTPVFFHGSDPTGPFIHMLQYFFLNIVSISRRFSHVQKTPRCHWHRWDRLSDEWLKL